MLLIFSQVINYFSSKPTKDNCVTCENIIYKCGSCECIYSNEHAARVCADWDKIMKHRSCNKDPHHHMDKD